jgi:hypothetical protein
MFTNSSWWSPKVHHDHIPTQHLHSSCCLKYAFDRNQTRFVAPCMLHILPIVDFLLSHIWKPSIRKYFHRRKNLSWDFKGFTRFQHPWRWTNCFWNAVCMYMRLATAWTVGHALLIFGIKAFIHHWSMLGECKYSSSKIGTIHRGPQTQNCDFLENGSSDFNIVTSTL